MSEERAAPQIAIIYHIYEVVPEKKGTVRLRSMFPDQPTPFGCTLEPRPLVPGHGTWNLERGSRRSRFTQEAR